MIADSVLMTSLKNSVIIASATMAALAAHEVNPAGAAESAESYAAALKR